MLDPIFVKVIEVKEKDADKFKEILDEIKPEGEEDLFPNTFKITKSEDFQEVAKALNDAEVNWKVM